MNLEDLINEATTPRNLAGIEVSRTSWLEPRFTVQGSGPGNFHWATRLLMERGWDRQEARATLRRALDVFREPAEWQEIEPDVWVTSRTVEELVELYDQAQRDEVGDRRFELEREREWDS